MNVSLTPELEKWVQDKVRSGLYGSSSEVVRDALRVLHQFEEERLKKFTTLVADIQVGLEQHRTGRARPLNSLLIESIKSEGRERLNG